MAAQLVMQLVAGETVAAGHHVVEGSFIARESCGCATRPLSRDVGADRDRHDPVASFTQALRKIALARAPARASVPRREGHQARGRNGEHLAPGRC